MHIIQRFLLSTLLFLGIAGTLTAQTTWTGSVGTDWNTAGNWSAGVPDANDDVTIPDVANDPVISGIAWARSVTVQTGGYLPSRRPVPSPLKVLPAMALSIAVRYRTMDLSILVIMRP